MSKNRLSLKLVFILLWLVLTLSLAVWWMFFSLNILSEYQLVLPFEAERIMGMESMLRWEGFFWMLLLFVGGMALVYLTIRDDFHRRDLEKFVASFSHDLKTSLASLRLQSESLKEDIPDNSLIDRLLRDTGRLQLQLENSLLLASSDKSQYYFQEVNLRELLKRVSYDWPNLQVEIQHDLNVNADERALNSIFKNLLQNAVVHGQAFNISVSVKADNPGKLKISVLDDGVGFNEDSSGLGDIFRRHNSNSGSGVGLYIVRKLIEDMGGKVNFSQGEQDKGFLVTMELEGRLL